MTTIGFLLIVGAGFPRVLMEYWPSFLLCVVFWSLLSTGNFMQRNYWLLPGTGCNAAATLANDGFMPVYGQPVTPGGTHIMGTPEASLQFLCDIYAGFSIGDFLLVAGIVLTFIVASTKNQNPLRV